MRRADYAHIDMVGIVVADFAYVATFQHSQQFGLDSQGQFANFIQKDRTATGDFEESIATGIGARECALLVAKQLAFNQVLR